MSCQEIPGAILQAKPKIYFMCYNIFGIGGTVRTTVNLANHLYTSGFDVEIISVKKTPGPRLPLNPDIPIIALQEPLGLKPFRDMNSREVMALPGIVLRNALRLIPSLTTHRGDDLYNRFNITTDVAVIRTLLGLDRDSVLVTTTPSFTLLATKIHHRRPDLRLIGQEHKQFSEHHKKLQQRIRDKYEELDILTVLTREALEEYAKFLPRNMLKIQENGTTLPSRNTSVERENLIVSLGRLSEQKGYDRLIRAYALIAEKYPDWRLEIYGDGALREELDTLIKSHSLAETVTIHPAVSDVSEVLRRASVFALSSIFEPFGMVIIEAMSYEVPVVAFDVPFGPKRIITQDSGILVEDSNIELYAEELSGLMTAPERRRQLGQGAIERVKEKYSIDQTGQQFVALLESLWG